MSEIQFLQAKSDVGSMIIVTGSITSAANTIIVSYTPATGNTFVIVSGSVVCDDAVTAAQTGGICALRIGTSVREYLNAASGLIIGGTPFTITPKPNSTIKGDILIGNSSNTYNLTQLTAIGITGNMYGTLIGYLE